MHYSIIPAEMIFDEWDGAELEQYREMTYNNRQFIVELMEENQAKIVQLLSTDPLDFMDPQYQPGTIIKFSAQIVQE